MGLKHEEESAATIFGSSIHKALEHWYTLPLNERTLTDAQCKKADLFVSSTDIDATGALQSIRQFALRAANLSNLDASDKRSISNGIKILKAYFKHYANDGYELMYDAKGPLVEREVEFLIYTDDNVEIRFFGSIDAILKNSSSGHIVVADHKTTHALGKEFYNRIRPNHQYTGYVWGAQECLGVDTNLFLVNGIQVAKTKCEFARQVTERTQEDFNELRSAVIHAVRTFLAARETNTYPMHAPQPCTMYGSCTYLDICSSPEKLRETIIKAKYRVAKGN